MSGAVREGEIGGPLSLCWLGVHRWSKWGEPHEVEVTRKSDRVECGGTGWTITTNEPITWREIWQARVCGSCGALQNREVRKVRE